LVFEDAAPTIWKASLAIGSFSRRVDRRGHHYYRRVSRRLVVIAYSTAALALAAQWTAAKIALAAIPPFELSTLRFAIASVLLVVVAVVTRTRLPLGGVPADQHARGPDRKRSGIRDDVVARRHGAALPARIPRERLRRHRDDGRSIVVCSGGPRRPVHVRGVPDLLLGGQPLWTLTRSADQLPRPGGWAPVRVHRPRRSAGAGSAGRCGHHPDRCTGPRGGAASDGGQSSGPDTSGVRVATREVTTGM